MDRISGHFRSIGHFGFQKLTNKIFLWTNDIVKTEHKQLKHGMHNGGDDIGVPIFHIPYFLPPNIPYPRFFNPNIPYPRFFTPQYPISQISQSIDHIPDFARLERVCHSFDIQLVRMDPILLDIFIIAVNILVHEHLELHFNNVNHSDMYIGSH